MIETRYLDKGAKWREFVGGTRGPKASLTAHWRSDGTSSESCAARWRALRDGCVIYVEGAALGYLVRLAKP